MREGKWQLVIFFFHLLNAISIAISFNPQGRRLYCEFVGFMCWTSAGSISFLK